MYADMSNLSSDTEVKEFTKLNLEDYKEEIEEVALIALKDFAYRFKLAEPKLVAINEPENSSYHGCFTLYHLNISVKFPYVLPDSITNSYSYVKCPDPYKEDEGIIQCMVWKGLISEKIEVSRLGTRLPPGMDKRGTGKNLTFQRPDLKESALGQLVDKLREMGLCIDQPTNTMMPVLAWESRLLDRRNVGAGFDEKIQHSIIVRVKPPRGKKSKPGLHGLWTVTIRERKWISCFSPQLMNDVKRGLREVWKRTFPSGFSITRDENTGKHKCSVRALSQFDPVFLATPEIVTLALFAMDNFNAKMGLKLIFERVIDAMKWRSSSIIYLLTLEASDEGNVTHRFMTSVTIDPSRELTESTPLVNQEDHLPKEIKELFKLGRSEECQ